MNEEQGKPSKRWYKKWPNIVVSLFLVCVIAWIIFLSTGQLPEEGESPFLWIPDEIRNSVADYAAHHNGSLPTLSGTYTIANCSTCSTATLTGNVINISALLTANGGLLREAPDGLALIGSGVDNCNGNASVGCKAQNHYVWIIDANGSIYSTCVGKGCTSNNSGYQGVWP